MKFKILAPLGICGLLALASPGSAAPQQFGTGIDEPEWVEEQVAPPPAFSQDHLIPIDMPLYVKVSVGVDPETIVVGNDGVVRYVIVMRNASGSSTAVYEGIRCVTDEVKTYARQSSSGQWALRDNPAWVSVNDNMPSRHAQAFARQGGCQSRLATSKNEIIAVLKQKTKPSKYQQSN